MPFPEGFPDTQAALQLVLQEAAEDTVKKERRPKGLYSGRPSPDWDQIGSGEQAFSTKYLAQ